MGKIVKGLSGTGISFQAGKLYLSVVGGKINLASGTSAAFKKSASFIIHYGPGGGGGISFESDAMRGYYITESKFRVVVAKMVNTAAWKLEATWRFVKAQITEQTETRYVTQTVQGGGMHGGTVKYTIQGDQRKQQESESSNEEVEQHEDEQNEYDEDEQAESDEDEQAESESEAVEDE